MLETGELKYVAPGKCMTRQQELAGERPDKQIKLDEIAAALWLKTDRKIKKPILQVISVCCKQ